MRTPAPSLVHRMECGETRPMLVWRFAPALRGIASGPYGGGLGDYHWVINASVHKEYSRRDPDVHLSELAAAERLRGPGAGLLTAVDVGSASTAEDGGVTAVATVGLGYPTWAAAHDGERPSQPGTINLVIILPVLLGDAALVNAVITATEAKVQALWECGAEATGTASDALFIGCDAGSHEAQRFAGPRSNWGSRLARAVHTAVAEGTIRWSARCGR